MRTSLTIIHLTLLAAITAHAQTTSTSTSLTNPSHSSSHSQSQSPTSPHPHFGPIDDATCNVEQLEEANDSQLFTILHDLVDTAFFRNFAVDLETKCPLSWDRDRDRKTEMEPTTKETKKTEEEKTKTDDNTSNDNDNDNDDNNEVGYQDGNEDDCQDSILKMLFSNNANEDGERKGCNWVAASNTESRCRKDGVASHCPKTCGTCLICADSGKRFRMKFFDSIKSCSWVSKNTGRCAKPGVARTCRSSCGTCS
mmetsp:Transcript_882/g.1323  ORF Transcript_882/g.1323 Transcript_882/m.1323 type:complete len:254 (-) Transcript_882:19-780(-)